MDLSIIHGRVGCRDTADALKRKEVVMDKLTCIDEEGAIKLAEDITREYMKSLINSYRRMLESKPKSSDFITATYEIERSENMLKAITGCLVDIEPLIQQTESRLIKEWEVKNGKTHWKNNHTC